MPQRTAYTRRQRRGKKARQKRQPVLFEDLYDKPVSVEFTRPHQTSDGGVILLDAMDKKMGLIQRIPQTLGDRRQRGKITYDLEALLRERIFAIAWGYPSCDDADRLAQDPALKRVCTLRDGRLASQPTLSRFENEVTRTDLFRIALAITETVIDCERRKRIVRKVRRITLDRDPTEDPTSRRAVIKAEGVVNDQRELRDTPRFVITNLSLMPENLYRYYRERGDAENRLKELHYGLRFDLTRCTSFLANQLRNLLTGAAYALYQQLRYAARRTELARAQVGTLRERLLQVGTGIKESVRRIVLDMPKTFAWYDVGTRLAHGPGAVT